MRETQEGFPASFKSRESFQNSCGVLKIFSGCQKAFLTTRTGGRKASACFIKKIWEKVNRRAPLDVLTVKSAFWNLHVEPLNAARVAISNGTSLSSLVICWLAVSPGYEYRFLDEGKEALP